MSEPSYEILQHAHDFHWYKKRIDVKARYEYKHHGEPSKYPCGVISEYQDAGNTYGPDSYYHNFIYKQEVVCSECGHKTLVWPDVSD